MELYQSNNFLTTELFTEVVSKYEWPTEYEVEDELPDGILMRFSESHLFFSENSDGEVELHFLASEIGIETDLDLYDALFVMIPNYQRLEKPLGHLNLIEDVSIDPSEQKIRNEMNDLCIIIQEYLLPYIKGDYDWINSCLEYRKNLDLIRQKLGIGNEIFEHPIYFKLIEQDPTWKEDLEMIS